MSYLNVICTAMVAWPILSVCNAQGWVVGIVYGIIGAWAAAITFANDYSGGFRSERARAIISETETVHKNNEHLAHCVAMEVQSVLNRRDMDAQNLWPNDKVFDDPAGPSKGI